MKRYTLIALAFLFFGACTQFDDTKIWDKLKDHEERIKSLETLCDEINANISSMQSILGALQDNDYVTGVSKIMEDGVETGYIITFSKSGAITIYHGKDGADGADGLPGAPGTDGADGEDGQDGQTPVIGVSKDADGRYYWTLNGEWMLGEDSEKIPATGKDGISPKLKIEDD